MEYPGSPGGQTRPLGPTEIIIGALMGAGGPTLVGVGDGGGAREAQVTCVVAVSAHNAEDELKP